MSAHPGRDPEAKAVDCRGLHRDDPLAGGGEMGALMRRTDWSKTGLGPVESWPRSLRTMLGVVLGSRFPMLLWWGPDLLHLYNDAYRPILRDKHPQSLAAPAAEIWAEVWDVAGPMARSVQDGGPATWTEDLQLFIKSGAIAEETYFTFFTRHRQRATIEIGSQRGDGANVFFVTFNRFGARISRRFGDMPP